MVCRSIRFRMACIESLIQSLRSTFTRLSVTDSLLSACRCSSGSRLASGRLIFQRCARVSGCMVGLVSGLCWRAVCARCVGSAGVCESVGASVMAEWSAASGE